MTPLSWYLLAINGIAFLTMGFDKQLARRGSRRVPERTLHTLALVGGTPGSFLGIQVFRHKSQKRSFLLVHWAIVVLQAAALLWWWQRGR